MRLRALHERTRVVSPKWDGFLFCGVSFSILKIESDAMRVAAAMVLTDEEHTALMKKALGRSTEARLVLRAKIVLAGADGAS